MILDKYFFALVLIMPIAYYFDLIFKSGSLIHYFYLPFVAVIYIFVSLFRSDFKLRAFSLDTYLISTLVLIAILNINSLRLGYSLFVLGILLIFLFFQLLGNKNNAIYEKNFPTLLVTGLFIFFNFALTFNSEFYVLIGDDFRFRGLSTSSNTLGIYLLINFIIFHYYSKYKLLSSLLYGLTIYSLFKANGASNLILGLFYPVYLLLDRFRNRLFYVYLAIMMAVYPFIDWFLSDILVSSSIVTRIHYSNKLFEEFWSSGIANILFGLGAGSSSLSISPMGVDYIKPHNDFLLILYDYGVFFLVFFIKIIKKLYENNPEKSFFIIIYMSSFYHNMIFNAYIIFIMLFFFYVAPPILKNKKNRSLNNS